MSDKLVELLKSAPYGIRTLSDCFFESTIKKVADYLAANGVVAQGQGKWILHRDGSGTCNKCHFTQKNVWDHDNWQNYCGHCGARMVDACGK